MLKSRFRYSVPLLIAAFGASAHRALPQPAANPPANEIGERGPGALPENALIRLGSARLRHGGTIGVSSLSPDGKILATAGERAVSLWDVETGNLIRRLPFDHAGTYSRPGLIFSADGARLAHCRHSDFACIWDVKTGAELAVITPPAEEQRMTLGSEGCFINQGKDLLLCCQGRIFTYNIEAKRFTGSVDVHAYELSPDGTTFLQMRDTQLFLSDTATGKEITRFDAVVQHEGYRDILAYAADGKSFALVHDHREIQYRKLPGGEVMAAFPLPEEAIRKFDEQSKYWQYHLSLSNDNRTLAMGTNFGMIYRWDLAAKKELQPLPKHSRGVTGSHFLADGRTLVSTSEDGVIRRWDLSTGRRVGDPDAYEGTVAAAFSTDGRWAAIGDVRGRLDLWDARAGRRVRTLQEDGTPVARLAFEPGNQMLAMADMRATVRFWQVPSGAPGAVWKREPDRIAYFLRMHFSPDGRLLSMSDYPNTTRILEVATGKMAWQGPAAMGDAFSADGKTFILGAPIGPYLTFVDAKAWTTRSVVRLKSESLDNRGELMTIAAAPDGRHLAVLFDRGCLALCDVEGEEKHRLANVESSVEFRRLLLAGGKPKNRAEAIAFSPDGRWLASGGSDAVITIWEVDTGKEVFRLSGHDGPISTLAFHPDGRTLFSFAQDGCGYLWDLMPKGDSRPPPLAERWWALNNPDPAEVYRAQWQLIADPKEATPFLGERLTPIPHPDAGEIKKWIADLDNSAFAVRDAASKELIEVGERVQGPIRKALADDVSLETRRRLKTVLDAVASKPQPETTRIVRAIMALERMGTPEARAVLESLSRGAAGARVTEDAAAALRRLDQRR
jgi:WD40 repeat protein